MKNKHYQEFDEFPHRLKRTSEKRHFSGFPKPKADISLHEYNYHNLQHNRMGIERMFLTFRADLSIASKRSNKLKLLLIHLYKQFLINRTLA